MFSADWLIIVDARVLTESNVAIFLIQGQITRLSNPIRPIITLIQDLMVIYILAKFSADCFKIVDARE